MAICGILCVDKPAEWTSRAVVDRVMRVAQRTRAGHAGTLDPLATGVLVVCVGPATRLIQYIQQMPKRYRATFLLGHQSPTDDITGEVALVEGAPEPTLGQVEDGLAQFTGEILQRPPQHSAVMVAGHRAYSLARRGHEFELPPRTVTVHSLAVTRYHYPELELEIDCGSGTYVRALGRDLAESLGTGAVMSALERSAIGRFRVEDAVPADELTADSLAGHLQPLGVAVGALPRIDLTEADLIELSFGRGIARRRCATGTASVSQSQVVQSTGIASGTQADPSIHWAGFDPQGRFTSILYEKHPAQLWPVHNFATD